jgi:UDPglucose 6-dehydrogenase
VPDPLAAASAEALMVLTEWPEFAAIDPFLIATVVETRVVIDGKNVLDPQRAAAAGLIYRGVGRVAVPLEAELELARAV